MTSLIQDVRRALRRLRQRPAPSLIAIGVLAAGLGATGAVLAVVHAIALRSLPFKDPDRLVALWDRFPVLKPGEDMPVSGANFADWQRRADAFQSMGAVTYADADLRVGESVAERAIVGRVTEGFFATLGVPASSGRWLAPDEFAGEPRVVVVSHQFARRHWPGSVSPVGRSLQLDGRVLEVVGVMPAGFSLDLRLDSGSQMPTLWAPYDLRAREAHRGNHIFGAIARLRHDVSPATAAAQMAGIVRDLAQQHPRDNQGTEGNVVPLRAALLGHFLPALAPLVVGAGLLLLAICINVAMLLWAQVGARRKEIALRRSLGARWSQVAQHLMVESLVVAMLGGLGGVVVVHAGLALIRRLWLARVAGAPTVEAAWPAWLGILAAALTVGFVIGALGVIQATDSSSHGLLQSGRTGTALSPASRRHRALLIVGQSALSVLLLVGAGLFLRSFMGLWRTATGFEQERVAALSFMLPENEYPTPAERARGFDEILQRLRSRPGIQAAAIADELPSRGAKPWTVWMGATTAPARGNGERSVEYPSEYAVVASPGYFDAMGIPRLRGRDFLPTDTDRTPPVAIVSRSFADKYWPGQDPLGRRIGLWGGYRWLSVVGVVADVRQDGPAHSVRPQFYVPYLGTIGRREKHLLVRALHDPSLAVREARQALQRQSANLAVARTQWLDEVVADGMSRERLLVTLSSLFAAVALGLAALAIYGVLTFFVSQRRGEIGVRMALGAQRRDVLRLILRDGLLLAGLGAAVGVAVALALSGGLEGVLHGISPRDPLTLGATSALFMLVATIAALIPAQRAASLDPAQAIRAQND